MGTWTCKTQPKVTIWVEFLVNLDLSRDKGHTKATFLIKGAASWTDNIMYCNWLPCWGKSGISWICSQKYLHLKWWRIECYVVFAVIAHQLDKVSYRPSSISFTSTKKIKELKHLLYSHSHTLHGVQFDIILICCRTVNVSNKL